MLLHSTLYDAHHSGPGYTAKNGVFQLHLFGVSYVCAQWTPTFGVKFLTPLNGVNEAPTAAPIGSVPTTPMF